MAVFGPTPLTRGCCRWHRGEGLEVHHLSASRRALATLPHSGFSSALTLAYGHHPCRATAMSPRVLDELNRFAITERNAHPPAWRSPPGWPGWPSTSSASKPGAMQQGQINGPRDSCRLARSLRVLRGHIAVGLCSCVGLVAESGLRRCPKAYHHSPGGLKALTCQHRLEEAIGDAGGHPSLVARPPSPALGEGIEAGKASEWHPPAAQHSGAC